MPYLLGLEVRVPQQTTCGAESGLSVDSPLFVLLGAEVVARGRLTVHMGQYNIPATPEPLVEVPP